MATNHGHGNNSAGNADIRFDKTDLGARGILIFFFVLAVFAIAMHLIVLGLYAGLTKIASSHEAESSPLAPQTYTPRDEILTNTANVNIQQFPEPRLMHHVGETGEMTKLLVKENAQLNAKPWQDSDGNIHLPINEAMSAVLSRLPVRSGSIAVTNYPGTSRVVSYPAPDRDEEQAAPAVAEGAPVAEVGK